MQQPYNVPNQIPSSDFMRYTGYTDNAVPYNMDNNYNGAAISQGGYSATAAPSTELARRPINRHLVSTVQRSGYDNTVDNWGQFGEDTLMEVQNTNGALVDSDSIDVLEEKAVVAKRDATSKRKSIPPFVQKLSR